MKANELRIGNIISSGNGIYRIYAISSQEILAIQGLLSKIGSEESVYSALNIVLRPIPLTEEILLKCGFVKVKNKDKEDLREYIGHTSQKARYAIFDTDIFITKVDKRGLLWRNIECDFMVLFYHKSIPIKYLHQLQNLYFVLTGQELEINL